MTTATSQEIEAMPTSALTWRFVRPGFHVNDETGLELRRGFDEETGIEWQIWTHGMGEGIGQRATLSAAKQRAAEIASRHPEWLH